MPNYRGTYISGFLTSNDSTPPPSALMLPGDYITSDNGVFYAMVREDGTFGVFRGFGPDSSGPALWVSSVTGPGFVLYGIETYKKTLQQGMVLSGEFTCKFFCSPTEETATDPWCITDPFPHDTTTGTGGQAWIYLRSFPDGVRQIFWKLTDEGDFAIFKGTSPSDSEEPIWTAGCTDQALSIALTDVVYDLSAGAFTPGTEGVTCLADQTIDNDNSSATVSIGVSGEQGISFSSGWSNTISSSTTVETSASAQFGIPEYAGGSYTQSTSQTNTNEQNLNGNTTWSYTYEWNETVTCPPYSSVQALVTVSKGTFTVPFTLRGTVTYQSGLTSTGPGTGVYTGDDCVNVMVQTSTPKASTAKASTAEA